MTEELSKFEQYRQRVEFYERDLNPKIARAKEAQMYALNGCNAYSLQGLKALFILNGGALLLVPTAQKMFEGTPALTKEEIINAAIAFTIGIVCTMIATMSAFYQQQFLAHQMHYECEYLVYGAYVEHFDNQDAISHRDKALEESNKQATYSQAAQSFAALLCVASLIAFGIGSFMLILGAESPIMPSVELP